MKRPRMKRGIIATIRKKKITILNLDGECRDVLVLPPENASYVREGIDVGDEVLYLVEGKRLVQIELWRGVPELEVLYKALPKETECVISA